MRSYCCWRVWWEHFDSQSFRTNMVQFALDHLQDESQFLLWAQLSRDRMAGRSSSWVARRCTWLSDYGRCRSRWFDQDAHRLLLGRTKIRLQSFLPIEFPTTPASIVYSVQPPFSNHHHEFVACLDSRSTNRTRSAWGWRELHPHQAAIDRR